MPMGMGVGLGVAVRGGGANVRYKAGTNYYVSPSGNDSNNGTASGTPWQTDSKIRSAIAGNTIKAGVFFYTASGVAVPYATLSELGQKGVADAVIAGTISHSGDVINFLGVIPLTSHFAQSQAIGARVVNWGTAGGMDNSRTLASSGWTNPSGSIWKLLAPAGVTPAAGFVWEGNTQLTPVTGANFAAVTAALGTAGTFWVDPTTSDVYVHATAGGTPNSNGITYRQAQSWFASDAPLVDMSGGYMTATAANYGTVKYTGTYNSANGVIISLNIGTGDGSKMTVIQRTIHDRWGKHGFELAAGSHDANAAQSTGMWVCDDCHTTNAPTGFTAGAYSDFVSYIDLIGAGPGKFYARFNNCQDAANSTSGWVSHNNGDTLQIRRIEWTNCTANGGGGFGAYECGNAVITNCTIYGTATGAPSFNAAGSTTITGTTFSYCLPNLGSAATPVGPIALIGCTFTPGVTFSSSCTIGGSGGPVTVTSDSACVWNLSGGNGNSATLARGGQINFTLGGTVTPLTSVAFLTAITPASGDVVTLTAANVNIAPASRTTAQLTAAYAGGSALTWTTASANGTTGVSWTLGSTYCGAPVGTGNPASLYSGIVTQAVGGNSTTITFSGFDSTNLNLLTVQLSSSSSMSGLTFAETINGSPVTNTWTLRRTATAQSASQVQLLDNIGGFRGANHVISMTATSLFGDGCLIAANKASGAPVYDQSVTATPGGGSANAAAITPAVAGELFVASAWTDIVGSTPFTIDSGYTRAANIDFNGGVAYGLGAGYMAAGSLANSQPLIGSSNHALGIIVGCYK